MAAKSAKSARTSARVQGSILVQEKFENRHGRELDELGEDVVGRQGPREEEEAAQGSQRQILCQAPCRGQVQSGRLDMMAILDIEPGL